MNVTRQDVNAQSALLTVTVSPADYSAKVNQALEKYRKQAKIPGFRPGKVPMGLVQKQFGKSVLAEEMNKLVSDALYKHIQEEKLEILGNPIPKEDSEVKGDFNNPGDFEFVYEIGYTPKIDIDLSNKSKYDYVKVKVDDKLIDQQVDDLRRRYGKLASVETVGDDDMLLVQVVELNDDDSIKEGGILHSSTTSLQFIEDKKVKAEFVGKKVGDKVNVDIDTVTRGDRDKAALLGISEGELAKHGKRYQLTINDIKHMELAELNQELFDKLFGEGAVTSEKELRERVANDLKNMFANDSDRLLTRSVYRNLLDNTKVELPDTFLKRWIRLSNANPITEEQVDAEYDTYARDLKWQLIQGHIFQSNDIKLEQKEALDYVKGLIVSQYAQYGIPSPEEKELDSLAKNALSNNEEANRIYDQLAEQKLMQHIKNTVKLNEKEVAYDQFVEMANN